MATEMRRAAKALVAPEPSSIASEYPVAESVDRVAAVIAGDLPAAGLVGEASLDGVTIRKRSGETIYRGVWKEAPTGLRLEGEFVPAASTQRHLKLTSVLLGLLLFSTAGMFLASEEASLKVSAALVMLFSIIGFRFVILTLSSNKAAREATIARLLQRSLGVNPS